MNKHEVSQSCLADKLQTCFENYPKQEVTCNLVNVNSIYRCFIQDVQLGKGEDIIIIGNFNMISDFQKTLFLKDWDFARLRLTSCTYHLFKLKLIVDCRIYWELSIPLISNDFSTDARSRIIFSMFILKRKIAFWFQNSFNFPFKFINFLQLHSCTNHQTRDFPRKFQQTFQPLSSSKIGIGVIITI